MSTNVTWNGVSYTVPGSGEVNWPSLSNFLIALGNNAAVAEEMKQAIRVATTTPVTVSDTSDCVVLSNLGTPGAVAVTLPAGTDGRWFVIGDQKGDAGTNNITITPNGAETINGSATYVINENRGCVVLAYSATNTRWNVIARFFAGTVATVPSSGAVYSNGTALQSETALSPARGGTGVANNSAATLTRSGNHALTLTTTNTTGVTLPTTGTLATLAGSETFTNKTLTSPTISGGTINNAPIGGSTPAAGDFTSVSVTGTLTASGTANTSGNSLARNAASTAQSVLTISKYGTTVGSSRLIAGAADTGTATTVRGYIRVNGATDNLEFESTSDRRLKDNIEELRGALDKIKAVRPVSYERKNNPGLVTSGFIAQEFSQVFPAAVTKTDDGLGEDVPDGVEPWTMSDACLTPYLVASIKELAAEVQSLKLEIQSLKGAE